MVQLGQQDADEASEVGSQCIDESAIHCFDLKTIRKQGLSQTITQALSCLTVLELAGYWIHFDVDVLDDAIMPAVDYHLPGGLSFAEASELLRVYHRRPKPAACRSPSSIPS